MAAGFPSRMKSGSLTGLFKPLFPAPLRRKLRESQYRIRSAWHRRFDPYYCPVCQTRVGGFNPMPSVYAEQWQTHGFDVSAIDAETWNPAQYSCPRCDATDRCRLYALYLRERLANLPGDFKLVDFAPSGPLQAWIKHSFQICYRTADLLMEDVDDRVDLTDLAVYPTASVDAFICSHMLEHIPNDTQAMRELFRILKPGGWGILMVPICLRLREISEDAAKATTEADRWRYFGQGDHVRFYSKKGFMDRVTSAGFKIQQFGVSHFGEDTFRRCGITSKSILYVVEKAGV
jgi:SAM-dependent methyltransferase